jgi:hypothetical protein
MKSTMLGALLVTLVVSSPAQAVTVRDGTTAAIAPPMVTIVMSRSEISAADNMVGHEPTGTCTQDNQNITPLPWVLKWLSRNASKIKLTGSVETYPTRASATWCAHYGETIAPSWQQLESFSSQYGMHFISHSADYPQQWGTISTVGWTDPYGGAYGSALADWQNWETCGSRDAITEHGLSGAVGEFFWPNQKTDPTVMANDVLQCFYMNRSYTGTSYINTLASVEANDNIATTRQLLGGPCSETVDPTAACRSVLPTATWYYTPPRQIINLINKLQPGDALNLQAYVLVTGTNPTYTTNKDQWDCTAANPAYHWSNDAERYCWVDFARIVMAIQNNPNIVVIDPQGVAQTWGMTPPIR